MLNLRNVANLRVDCTGSGLRAVLEASPSPNLTGWPLLSATSRDKEGRPRVDEQQQLHVWRPRRLLRPPKLLHGLLQEPGVAEEPRGRPATLILCSRLAG